MIVRIYESIRFSQLLTASAVQHNKQRLFYLVQKILGYVHAQNCIILKTILSTSLMWKKDLKLHHNLSLTITDKTSYDIPTLVPEMKLLHTIHDGILSDA